MRPLRRSVTIDAAWAIDALLESLLQFPRLSLPEAPTVGRGRSRQVTDDEVDLGM